MTKKRQPTTSNFFLQDAHKAAVKPMPIPPEAPEMTERAVAIYRLYGQGKARPDWLPHELVLLAQLANLTVDHQDVMEKVSDEGFVVTNSRGTQIANPLFAVGDALLRQILSLTRSLGLASVTTANKQNTTKRALAAKEATEAQTPKKSKRTTKVSLLARPTEN